MIGLCFYILIVCFMTISVVEMLLRAAAQMCLTDTGSCTQSSIVASTSKLLNL